MSADGATPRDPDEGPDEIPDEVEDAIDELRELGVEPSSGFLRGIYRRLNRRLLAGQLVDFSSLAWVQALVEYLGMLFGSLGTRQRPKGGNQ